MLALRVREASLRCWLGNWGQAQGVADGKARAGHTCSSCTSTTHPDCQPVHCGCIAHSPVPHVHPLPDPQVKPIHPSVLSCGPFPPTTPGSQRQPAHSLPLPASMAPHSILDQVPLSPLTWAPAALAPPTCSVLRDTALFILQREEGVSLEGPGSRPGKASPAPGVTVRQGEMGAMEGS